MEAQDVVPAYHIWGVDNTSYGPVELPMLVNWIKDERVLGHTWIFAEHENAWLPAEQVPELHMFFRPRQKKGPQAASARAPSNAITPGALRRIKALADMAEEHLAALVKLIEPVEIRPFTHLIKKGDPGDAIYGVFEGELRSCLLLEGRECPLATLGPGSIFGEISFFDRGPHAADVISNTEGTLIRISADAISRLSQESPAAAVGLLEGLIKSIAGRVRTLTRRYESSVQIVQRAEEIQAA